ncbi:MAG: hypothetical protein DMG76_08450 [Acidobacteria bacterium]|nr:MAG: hypothetical protein DMG76_08450 [Acidobacteriota bacterium]
MSRATVALGVLLIFSRVALVFCPAAVCPWNLLPPRDHIIIETSERTSADYHAGGLTIVIFGESYGQFRRRSG